MNMIDVSGSRVQLQWRLRILSGAEATETQLKRAMPGASVVHLATHGFFHPEGLTSLWEGASAARDIAKHTDGGALSSGQSERWRHQLGSAACNASAPRLGSPRNRASLANNAESTDCNCCWRERAGCALAGEHIKTNVATTNAPNAA